jgi:UDPglucose 6-dehydrogenase
MGSEYGLNLPIVAACREVNYRQRDRVVERLQGVLKILKGRTVALLGLTFKPHTDDLRDSPALDIARRLIARGARAKVHDPVALGKAEREIANSDILWCPTAAATAVDADAIVLTTEWPEYRDLAWPEIASSMRTPFILDGRNFLDEERLRAAGFRYDGIGR